MLILAGILSILFIAFVLFIGTVIISFFITVPVHLKDIASAMEEKNKIEREKIEILKSKHAKEDAYE